jgi:hypothetical protein
MAAICADCRTANRDGAKFCKGCGHRLKLAPPANATEIRPDVDEDWPATQRMPWRQDVVRVAVAQSAESGAPSPAEPPRLDDHRQKAKSVPSAKVAAVRKTRTNRVGAWILLTSVIVVAGSWYAYSSRITTRQASVPTPPPVVQPPSVPVLPAPEPAPVELSAPPPAEPQVVTPQATQAKPVVPPAPKKRKAAPAPISTPDSAAQPVAPAPVPEPLAPANPQTACEGLNFFARARCMAAQCAQADYKAHPQCAAVRRQQQIDEEKRNPSLIN